MEHCLLCLSSVAPCLLLHQVRRTAAQGQPRLSQACAIPSPAPRAGGVEALSSTSTRCSGTTQMSPTVSWRCVGTSTEHLPPAPQGPSHFNGARMSPASCTQLQCPLAHAIQEEQVTWAPSDVRPRLDPASLPTSRCYRTAFEALINPLMHAPSPAANSGGGKGVVGKGERGCEIGLVHTRMGSSYTGHLHHSRHRFAGAMQSI